MATAESISIEMLKRLHNEIKLAEKRNEAELLPVLQENLARYTGRFIPNLGINWDIVLNEVYPIVQFNIPSVFFRNPRAFLKPKTKTFQATRRNLKTGNMEPVFLDATKSAKNPRSNS